LTKEKRGGNVNELGPITEGDGDPWRLSFWPFCETPIGVGFEYREKSTGKLWKLTATYGKAWHMVDLWDGNETVKHSVDWVNGFFEFVTCHHDDGCCRIHETHSQVHNGCFLPRVPKGKLPLALGDEWDDEATGECFVIVGLPGDGRVTLGQMTYPLAAGERIEVAESELEQKYTFFEGYDYCACKSPDVACPVHPFADEAPKPEPEPRMPSTAAECEHETRCCPEHGSHVRPHRGCSLRAV
jgi:hypothetical protein